MKLSRFCRKHATFIQFLVLLVFLCYLIHTLQNIKRRSEEIEREDTDPFGVEANNVEMVSGDTIPGKGQYKTLKTNFGPIPLAERISYSTQYILNHINQDGTFVYAVNLNPNIVLPNNYNLLRHAGTIYALATISESFPDPRINSAIIKTAEWLKNRIAPLDDQNDILALWSQFPEVKDGVYVAKLGGAGLGLVSLLRASKLNPSLIEKQKMEKVGGFIQFMQKDSGRFNSRWDRGRGVASFNSMYYPGEACLGLSLLSDETKNRKWFDLALKGMKYLAESRKKQRVSEVLPDHWALISTRELLQSPWLGYNDRRILIEHAQKVISKLIYEQRDETGGNADIAWSFDSKGGIAPACTRLEGLIAMLHALDTSQQPPGMKEAVEKGIKFVLDNQETTGEYKGGFRRQVRQMNDGRHMEIRIDNVQHCVTALVKYYQLVQKYSS